jgi:hypothetical protein
MDSNSWAERTVKYTKKFKAGRKYIPKIFAGFEPLPQIEQMALFGYGGPGPAHFIDGVQVVLVRDWLEEILTDLTSKPIARHAVPEQYFCLRTMQFMVHHKVGIPKP